MRVRSGVDQIHGDVEAGYGAVADVFRRQFAQGREIGAACAVHRDGRLVVDLWGGYRDEHCITVAKGPASAAAKRW
jgi:hypothetical protein